MIHIDRYRYIHSCQVQMQRRIWTFWSMLIPTNGGRRMPITGNHCYPKRCPKCIKESHIFHYLSNLEWVVRTSPGRETIVIFFVYQKGPKFQQSLRTLDTNPKMLLLTLDLMSWDAELFPKTEVPWATPQWSIYVHKMFHEIDINEPPNSGHPILWNPPDLCHRTRTPSRFLNVSVATSWLNIAVSHCCSRCCFVFQKQGDPMQENHGKPWNLWLQNGWETIQFTLR